MQPKMKLSPYTDPKERFKNKCESVKLHTTIPKTFALLSYASRTKQNGRHDDRRTTYQTPFLLLSNRDLGRLTKDFSVLKRDFT